MPGTNQLTSRDIAYRIRSAGVGRRDHRRRRRRQDRRDRAGAARRCGCGSRSRRRARRLARLRRDARRRRRRRGSRAPTARDDPMILFFTSGTVSYPKMVLHAGAYGARPRLDRSLLARPAARRPALDGDRHRLGEGRLGRAVRAVARARDASSRWRSASPTPTRSSRSSATAPDHLVLRAADALPAARPGRLSSLRPRRAAPLHQRRRAAQPGGDPGLEGGHRRPDGLRRLRPVGDDACSSPTTAAVPVRPGSMGKPVPGWDVDVLDDDGQRAADDVVGERSPCSVTDPRPVGLFPGYVRRRRGQRQRVPRRLVLHRRQGLARRRRLPLVRGPRRRRDHLVRLPDRPVRGRVGAGRASGRDRGGGGRQGRSASAPRS